MKQENKIEIEISIMDEYFKIQELLKELGDNKSLSVYEKSTTPLHLGTEEIITVLSITGSVASIISLIQSFKKRKRKFEIQYKNKSGEIIILSKTKPWLLKDLKDLFKK